MNTEVRMLGYDKPLKWSFKSEMASIASNSGGGYMSIKLPNMSQMQHVQWAWSLKISHISN